VRQTRLIRRLQRPRPIPPCPDMHMEMNGHMFMTTPRPPNPADQQRAGEILAALRPAIEKYKDYHVALAGWI
jgi:hypothetical protein